MNPSQSNMLLVGRTNCLHFARWTKWLSKHNPHARVHGFPTGGFDAHSQLRQIKIHGLPLILGRRLHSTVRRSPIWWWPMPRGVGNYWLMRQSAWRRWEAGRLARLIDRLQPSVVHLFEIQSSGYLYLDAVKLLRTDIKPRVVLSTMGSDLFHFHEIECHRKKIRKVLDATSLIHTDCGRDVDLVRGLGYDGDVEILEWLDDISIEQMNASCKLPSKRKVLLVRGSDYWAVSGLTALRAVQQSSLALAKYEVIVYSASPNVQKRVKELAQQGLRIRALGRQTPEQMQKLFQSARALLSVSRSDGTMVAMMEAMAHGCFPIVSENAVWQPWIKPGKTGLVLKSQELSHIKQSLERVLIDDLLVDRAMDPNQGRIRAWFDALDRGALMNKLYPQIRLAQASEPNKIGQPAPASGT